MPSREPHDPIGLGRYVDPLVRSATPLAVYEPNDREREVIAQMNAAEARKLNAEAAQIELHNWLRRIRIAVMGAVIALALIGFGVLIGMMTGSRT